MAESRVQKVRSWYLTSLFPTQNALSIPPVRVSLRAAARFDKITDATYVATIYELSVVVVIVCYRPGHSLEGTNAQGTGRFVYTTGSWERLRPVREMRSTIRNQGTTIHHSICMEWKRWALSSQPKTIPYSLAEGENRFGRILT